MKTFGPAVTIAAAIAAIVQIADGAYHFGKGDVIFLLSLIIFWATTAWLWSRRTNGPGR